ncbi:MAG TPA: hypothetical protein DCZ97_07750 [Syntrophus sp. (in: bacteria)]|nr:hypothetical protein [Syntrophus sp. (in: bacteria)]
MKTYRIALIVEESDEEGGTTTEVTEYAHILAWGIKTDKALDDNLLRIQSLLEFYEPTEE